MYVCVKNADIRNITSSQWLTSLLPHCMPLQLTVQHMASYGEANQLYAQQRPCWVILGSCHTKALRYAKFALFCIHIRIQICLSEISFV